MSTYFYIQKRSGSFPTLWKILICYGTIRTKSFSIPPVAVVVVLRLVDEVEEEMVVEPPLSDLKMSNTKGPFILLRVVNVVKAFSASVMKISVSLA